MKTLIAIITCKKNAARMKAQQETWIPEAINAGYDVEIFDGERLGVDDGYYGLMAKTKALCQWAAERGYDSMLKIDDDGLICLKNLKVPQHDYAGMKLPANDMGSPRPPKVPDYPRDTFPYPYASGGAYWLSKRAIQIVANAFLTNDWAEDRWCGNTLARHGIHVTNLPDYAWVMRGNYLPEHWKDWTVLTQVPVEKMRNAYEGKALQMVSGYTVGYRQKPLVSCLMPTYNRREFIPRAIRCFKNQDYENREMIILDDGEQEIRDLIPSDLRIRYIHSNEPRQGYGAKMNRCFAYAKGSFCIVWDDDDVYAPSRISRQIQPMLDNPSVLVTGSSKLYYYRHGTQKAYRYSGNDGSWIGAIAIRRKAWETHKFDTNPEGGADLRWLKNISRKNWIDLKDPLLVIAAIHAKNDCPKNDSLNNPVFVEEKWEHIERLMEEYLKYEIPVTQAIHVAG